MPSISGAMARAAERLAGFTARLASIGLVFMTIVIVWQVVGRYVLNSSPPWSERVALLTMLYVVMLAAAVGVYEQFHIGVRFFVSKLPARSKRAVFVLGQLLIVVFGAAMVANGIRLVDFTRAHTIPPIDVSRSVAYWPFVICGSLIVIFALVRCVGAIREDEEADPWS